MANALVCATLRGMSAEDHFESFVPVSHPERDVHPPSVGVVFTTAVVGWLAARIASTADELVLQVSVLPGRWIVRTERVSAASSLEQAVRAPVSAADVAGAISSWARSQGASSRLELLSASDVRVTLGVASPRA